MLGAGPLQGAIGDQLTGQVEQLRTERNELRDQLDQANVTLGDDARYIEAAGPQLVAGSLQDRRVAVVDLDGADDERDDAIAAQLETAGASVVGHVRLTDSWTSQDEESARQTVAEGLGDKLGDVPQDATPEQRLSRALALSLTGAAPSSTEERSPEALELEALLERFALVDVVSEQTLPADVVLLLGGSAPSPATPAAEGEEPPAPDTYAVDIEVQVAARRAGGRRSRAGRRPDGGLGRRRLDDPRERGPFLDRLDRQRHRGRAGPDQRPARARRAARGPGGAVRVRGERDGRPPARGRAPAGDAHDGVPRRRAGRRGGRHHGRTGR
nr:copper transporter [Cellulosimicrobium sp. MM]